MSGYKQSTFQLQRERAEKLRSIERLNSAYSGLDSLRAHIARKLADTSAGLRASFPAEVERVQQWLDRTETTRPDNLGMDTSQSDLDAAASQVEQEVCAGQQIQEVLIVSLAQKADELGSMLSKRLAALERLYVSREHLFELWIDKGQRQTWDNTLQDARRLLDEEHYSVLEQLLARFEVDMEEKGRSAEAQEEKQQKRLYLLRALRQVCSEMGFREVIAPHYLDEGRRGSRIEFTVDTLDRGKIAFTLSLESISTLSEIADNRCFEEFGKLSSYLEEQFGIQTDFRTEDGSPVPKLRHQGEMEEPNNGEARSAR